MLLAGIFSHIISEFSLKVYASLCVFFFLSSFELQDDKYSQKISSRVVFMQLRSSNNTNWGKENSNETKECRKNNTDGNDNRKVLKY